MRIKHFTHGEIDSDNELTENAKKTQHKYLRVYSAAKNKRRRKYDFSDSQKRLSRSENCGCGLKHKHSDHWQLPIEFCHRFSRAYSIRYGYRPNLKPMAICGDCHKYKSELEKELVNELSMIRLNGLDHAKEAQHLFDGMEIIHATINKYQDKKGRRVKKINKAGRSNIMQKITARKQKITRLFQSENLPINRPDKMPDFKLKQVNDYKAQIVALEKA